ncbi:uncharacterized protein H6S33_002197 [Morchella sextelata]|uniref:uncharacterized protein n=1 Tax=Morchella sextelata TaxID=1174677 RepID=UPI001D03FA93|nr:uncharacterized protein H6S33_002197 [Morchella sextelata]KAH0608145.1 hypothetical protein H6S33_002197 [Morchella sextelata]
MSSVTPTKREKKSKKHSKEDKGLKRKRHAESSQPSLSPEISKKPRTAIASTKKQAQAQNGEPKTPFHLMTTSLYLSVSPRYSFWPEETFGHLISNPDPSLRPTSEQAARMLSFTPINGLRKDHLDPLLMSYYEPLDGVVIAYDNIRFESDKARIAAESPFAHVWVTVDFLVWKPKKGDVLQGWVNLQSASHVGLLVENTWNVSIPKEKIPESWSYHEVGEEEGMEGMEGVEYGNAEIDAGGWMDANGEYVDGLLKFQVESVQAIGHIFSMEGSLLNTEVIESVVFSGKKEKRKDKKHKKSKSLAAE